MLSSCHSLAEKALTFSAVEQARISLCLSSQGPNVLQMKCQSCIAVLMTKFCQSGAAQAEQGSL